MQLILFGTGECSKRVLSAVREGVEVIAASDNNPKTWNGRLNGVPVIRPADIPATAYDYVVVCSAWAGDIVDPLAQMGIPRDKILSFYEAFQYDPLRARELSILRELIDLSAAAGSVQGHLPDTSAASPLDAYRHYEEWLFERNAHKMEGYFTKQHAAVLDIVLGAQECGGVTGDLLEIGVFHGRSAVMAALHQAPSEMLTLADASRSESVTAFIQRHAHRRIEYIVGDCRRTLSSDWLTPRAERYRWVHIDGNHTFPFVYGDLERADVLLQADGIVCMDDAFSVYFPDVTQALYLYLHQHPGRFELFALGDGKAYLCRPQSQERYYDALMPLFEREIAKRGWALKVKQERSPEWASRKQILFRP